MDDAESLKTQVQAVFKRAQSSVGSHPACIKELGVLLEDYELEFVAVFQDAVIALLLNKQLKSEGATRVRDMMAKFVAAPDRDSKSKQWRDCLTSLIQRCIRTIRAATRVQDNDIRHCATSMLATIVTLSARWMGYVSTSLFRRRFCPVSVPCPFQYSFSSSMMLIDDRLLTFTSLLHDWCPQNTIYDYPLLCLSPPTATLCMQTS